MTVKKGSRELSAHLYSATETLLLHDVTLSKHFTGRPVAYRFNRLLTRVKCMSRCLRDSERIWSVSIIQIYWQWSITCLEKAIRLHFRFTQWQPFSWYTTLRRNVTCMTLSGKVLVPSGNFYLECLLKSDLQLGNLGDAIIFCILALLFVCVSINSVVKPLFVDMIHQHDTSSWYLIFYVFKFWKSSTTKVCQDASILVFWPAMTSSSTEVNEHQFCSSFFEP